MCTDSSSDTGAQRRSLEVLLLALGLAVLSLAFRCTETDAMVNVDMFYLWSKRITRFIDSIRTGDLAGTYQSHHPGVVLMWAVGLLWKHAHALSDPLDAHKLRLATLPIALVGSLFPASTFLLMLRALGRGYRTVAWLTGALFATEPLFVAHSRTVHLDMLVTAFAWSAVLAALIARRELSMKWGGVSGALLGLALSTKLSAAGFALGIAIVYTHSIVSHSGTRRQTIRVLTAIVVTAALVVLLLWPALWVGPIETIEKLRSGLQHEVDKTSEFMFLGATGKLHLPRWIYGLFLVYLVTPEFWCPALLALALPWRHAGLGRFALEIVVATAPLILLLIASARIGNRYLIPTLPMFGTLAAIGSLGVAAWFDDVVRHRWSAVVAATLVIGLVAARCLRLAALHPLPITYCSSWTGIDCSRVFHIGWGEGMKEASRIVAEQARLRGYAEPPVIFGSTYAGTMRVWTPLAGSGTIDRAQLLVDYLPDRQRHLKTAQAIGEYVRLHQLLPLGEVIIQGRTYVSVFAGPLY
jgi:4-amino-4-deoxy-L-arabinose transferase-like glycosyltransferase